MSPSKRASFDGGEVELAEGRQVDAVVGLANDCSRSKNAVPEGKGSVPSGVLLRNNSRGYAEPR